MSLFPRYRVCLSLFAALFLVRALFGYAFSVADALGLEGDERTSLDNETKTDGRTDKN